MMQVDPTSCSRPSTAAKLLAAKPALPSESFASWIQRVCGDHQYNMPTLIRMIGYEPPMRDWDLPMPHSVWERMLQLSSLDTEHEHQSLSSLGSVWYHIHAAHLLWHEGRVPRYRWCRECFRRDEIPYLRWYWRLSALTWCPYHMRQLSEVCPTCNAPMLVNTSRLVASGLQGNALTLADCSRCGMPLREPKPRGKFVWDEKKAQFGRFLSHWQELSQFIDAETAKSAFLYLAPRLPTLSEKDMRKAPQRVLSNAVDAQPYTALRKFTGRARRKRLLYEKVWLKFLTSEDHVLRSLIRDTAYSWRYESAREKAQKTSWCRNLNAQLSESIYAYVCIAYPSLRKWGIYEASERLE